MKKKAKYKTKAKSKYIPKAKRIPASISPEIVQNIRNQVIKDLNDTKKREIEKQAKIKVEAETAHATYLSKMHASTEPWVEVQSWTDTPQGVKIELDWNDAFVTYLRANGYTGADDDQLVQKYLALLTQHVTDGMTEKQSSELE